MKHINRSCRILIVAGFAPLFCCVAGAQVEKPLRPVDPKVLNKPSAQATPPADSQPTRKPPSPKPAVQIDRNNVPGAMLLVNGISGGVRWKKKYGLPYNSSNDGRPVHPYPCQIFHVRSTVAIINRTNIKLPGGVAGDVGTVTGKDFGTAGPPPEDGEYYVCHFTVTDLPLNRAINIQVEIDSSFLPPDYKGFDRSVSLTAPWVGGSEPQPPSGQFRTIKGNTGLTGVTLTEQNPHAAVAFEMIYAPPKQLDISNPTVIRKPNPKEEQER